VKQFAQMGMFDSRSRASASNKGDARDQNVAALWLQVDAKPGSGCLADLTNPTLGGLLMEVFRSVASRCAFRGASDGPNREWRSKNRCNREIVGIGPDATSRRKIFEVNVLHGAFGYSCAA
jgi:hypothetical protein